MYQPINQSTSMITSNQLSVVSVFRILKRSFVIKPILWLLAIFMLTTEVLSAQATTSTKKSTSRLDTKKGYITINDLSYGIGLSKTNVPYSDSYFGFTTIQGYQINKSYVFGAGTGFLVYNAGKAAPLFLDFQYRFTTNRSYTAYASADGGLLFKFGGDEKSADLFVNPAIGVRRDFSRDAGADFSIGMMIQQGSTRNSFINIKLGVTIKP
jgi:hypothetical protein